MSLDLSSTANRQSEGLQEEMYAGDGDAETE